MDLGFPLLPVCVMMVCLLGAERCSSDGKITCPCSEIPPKDFTEPPSNTCHGTREKFRYNCVQGRLRKVGTSNLTKCKIVDGIHQWTTASLECIPDPKIPPTTPPRKITSPAGSTDIPHGTNITTTVTAASTSSQMTQMISISASATTDTDSVEPTSPGLQVPSDHSQEGVWTETDATSGTSSPSTTTETHNSTVEPRVSDPGAHQSSLTRAAIFTPLVIICAGVGICVFLYKRRSKNRIPHAPDECVKMNDDIAPPGDVELVP